MKKPKRKKKPRVYKLRTDNGLNLKVDEGANFDFIDWDNLPKTTDTIEIKVLMPVTRCYAVISNFEAP